MIIKCPGKFRTLERISLILLFVVFFALPADIVHAGFILGAEVRGTYEDNVVGLLSGEGPAGSGEMNADGRMTGGSLFQKMGSMDGMQADLTGSNGYEGDYSLTVAAEAGAYTPGIKSNVFFAKGFAQRTTYVNYDELSSTIAGAAAGMDGTFNDAVSGRVSIIAKRKLFGDEQRDSSAYSALLFLVEKPTPEFQIREHAGFEHNRARSPLFTYRAVSAGLTAGWRVNETTLASLGYAFVSQKYSSGGEPLTSNTVLIGMDYLLSKNWSVGAEYDRQMIRSKGSRDAVNNVISLAVRYGY